MLACKATHTQHVVLLLLILNAGLQRFWIFPRPVPGVHKTQHTAVSLKHGVTATLEWNA